MATACRAMPVSTEEVAPSLQQGLAERVAAYHRDIRAEFPRLDRIAVAIYDSRTDLLRSFVDSSEGGNPFEHTMARLADLPELARVARSGGIRVIDDMVTHQASSASLSRRLVKAGYLSSFAMPIHHKGAFQGFVFFNSFLRDYFTPSVIRGLRPVADLVALTTVMELEAVRMLQAAVHTVRQMSRARDEETHAHLERMARYARIIALRLAPRRGRSDEWVEFLYQFAPLHDIGNIGVPDHILFKPGRLTPEEFEVMKQHVAKGCEIVEVMAGNFGIDRASHVDILHNVVGHHHECVDGSGYPLGLSGDAVSLEGRIVAVADVFDALTSNRPYKKAWTNDEALAFLTEQAGRKFDPEAVDILCSSQSAVRDIQRTFTD